MPDSSAIDNALLEKLRADATLGAWGVYFEEAPAPLPGAPVSSRKFIIVSLVISLDTRVQGRRAVEEQIYMVKAVALSTAGADMGGAARRIDELLDPQPPAPPATLVVPGYTLMAIHRYTDDPRVRFTEPDSLDQTIRWFHRGGRYRVVLSS